MVLRDTDKGLATCGGSKPAEGSGAILGFYVLMPVEWKATSFHIHKLLLVLTMRLA